MLHPRTGRLERLSLGNALLGRDSVGAGEAVAVPFRPEHAAVNVDLTGQVCACATSRPLPRFQYRAPATELQPPRPSHTDADPQVRGRCTSCVRCTGYERLERHAENENDVDVLRCARCGCMSHRHEPI